MSESVNPSPQGSMRNPSVRVRRRGYTVSQAPGQPSVPEGTPILEPTPPSPAAASAPSAPGSPTAAGSGTVGSVGSNSGVRRKRGYTLTERLFSPEAYTPLAGDSDEARQVRSASVSSSGSASRAARSSSPVQINLRARGNSVGRTSSLTRRRAGSTSVVTEEDEHADHEVDLLEVLDQSVSTTSALVNIQGAFWPNTFSRAPVLDIDPPTPIEEEAPSSDEDGTHRDVLAALDEESDPLDAHLARIMRKQKRKDFMKQTAKGIWAFMKTPIGVLATIYGILVVFWGAGLVLILVTAIPMSSYNKKLWVEIASQILTGLFCITSLLPLPWRLRDTWNILAISRYASITRKRRAKQNLAPLRDPNDLPDTGEYWIGPGGARISGARTAPTTAPPVEKKKKSGKKGKDGIPTPPNEEASASADRPLELAQLESRVDSTEKPPLEEEIAVLSPVEAEKLRKAQISFGQAQTWFSPHSTPTHHATPISMALWVAVCLVGNSVFQALLCVAMWGWNRYTRPTWTTGCLIPLSFGCGIAAAILIWRAGENTKKKREVSRAVWKMMKKDEEEFAAKVKSAQEAKAAEKEAKKHHHHTGSTTALPAPAVEKTQTH